MPAQRVASPPKTLVRESIRDSRVACGKIRSPSLSLSLCDSAHLCASLSGVPRLRSAALTCRGNSRDPSRAAIPGSLLAMARRVLCSLPVGRHYPGASRESLLYAAKERYRVDEREVNVHARTHTHADRRCVCTRIRARYRGPNSPRGDATKRETV